MNITLRPDLFTITIDFPSLLILAIVPLAALAIHAALTTDERPPTTP